MSFKHSQHMPWILPGIPPTNKQVVVTIVSIVCIRGGKLYSEHVYWDQASVLLQVGLLDPKLVPEKLRGQGVHRLPIVGREAAMRILEGEDGKQMNELVPGWGSGIRGKEEGGQPEEETETEEETAETDEEGEPKEDDEQDQEDKDDEEPTQTKVESDEVEEDTDEAEPEAAETQNEADATEEAENISDGDKSSRKERETSQQEEKPPQGMRNEDKGKGMAEEAENGREAGVDKTDDKAEVKEETIDEAER